MGWFTRKKDADAEQSLRRLQERREREPEIEVTITDPPAATTAGTPLSCYNEGDPVRVGDAVQVFGSLFVDQPGRIMAMTRDGVPIETLDYGEQAEVVLDDGVDLSEVYRGGCLAAAGETRARNPSFFVMQVLRAEPRGADALVIGRVAGGQVTPGDLAIATHGRDEQTTTRRVLAVEPMGEELGLVIEGRAADRYLPGDQVSTIKPA